jgi:hypothetical protein
MAVMQDETLIKLERLIRRGSEVLQDARAILRIWLIDKTQAAAAGLSIADAVALLPADTESGSRPAKVLLRCLAIPNLVPSPNSANQLARHVVALCDGALPEISAFLHLSDVKQTHEKFAILTAAHIRLSDLLSPLKDKYLGMESFLASRKPVIAALNHSIVRSYGEPFGIAEMRRIIEVMYHHFQKAASLEGTLSSDLANCRQIIADGRSLIDEAPTALNVDFLSPLLDSADAALNSFLKSVESRLATDIDGFRRVNSGTLHPRAAECGGCRFVLATLCALESTPLLIRHGY